jgi:phosphoserine phosphatase RsbU/P
MTSERTHILIVDDEPGMLRAVKKIFQRNHDITTAESGEDALEKLSQCAPDLAIVDVRMPGINGFELTRRLKQHDPHLDVILMTGNAEEPDDNLIKAIDGGAFYFIQKPFDRRVVITLVNRCLELRRLRNAELRYVNRLEQELDEAQQFQLSLLPPPYQHIAGVNIHARYLACSELAGDIYDYAPAGQDAVAFMVADVVGHGASAAMMTSVVKSAFHAAAGDDFVPLKVIERVKEGLRTFDASRFVTLTCGRLDTKSGTLNYVNAGHPAGILHKRGIEPRMLESTAPMLSSTFNDIPFQRRDGPTRRRPVAAPLHRRSDRNLEQRQGNVRRRPDALVDHRQRLSGRRTPRPHPVLPLRIRRLPRTGGRYHAAGGGAVE